MRRNSDDVNVVLGVLVLVAAAFSFGVIVGSFFW